jgi:hypothetical protein
MCQIFKYLGITITVQNYIGQGMNRLNAGSNPVFFRLLFKSLIGEVSDAIILIVLYLDETWFVILQKKDRRCLRKTF